jgi:hypothetical protein
MITFLANDDEASLVEDIEEVGYGELYNLIYAPRPATISIEITQKTKDFLASLRIIGSANRLVVHDSEPALLEYRGITGHGRRCMKKMKF